MNENDFLILADDGELSVYSFQDSGKVVAKDEQEEDDNSLEANEILPANLEQIMLSDDEKYRQFIQETTLRVNSEYLHPSVAF